MKLKLSSDSRQPVYRQIAQAVREAVASGRLAADEKLPAVVVLAKELGVNPLTVRRGYELLRSEGVVRQISGSGTYIQPEAVGRVQGAGQAHFKTITVVVGAPSLVACDRERVFFISEIMAGVEQVLGGEGGRNIRFEFAESFTRSCLGDLQAGSAVLVYNAPAFDPALFMELERRRVPVMAVWGHDFEFTHIPRVHYTPFKAPALACQHLIACGYRRIGFVGGKGGNGFSLTPKFLPFASTLHDAGMDYRAAHVLDEAGMAGPCRAYRAMQKLIAGGDLPEAMFVESDFKAFEVIRALQDAGLSVPDDIGIVSQDDLPEAARCDPPLTTVSTRRVDIGRRAAELLLAWAEGEPLPTWTAIEPKLVVRSSTRVVDSVAADQHEALSEGEG